MGNMNEPDYTTSPNDAGNWKTESPNPKDLSHWHGDIELYLNISNYLKLLMR